MYFEEDDFKMSNAQDKAKPVAAIGDTKQSAVSSLRKQLPFPEGSIEYRFLSDIVTQKLPDKTWMAVRTYLLKPGYEDRVVQSGTGTYRTPMEIRHGDTTL